MDPRAVEWFSKLVYMQMQITQAAIQAQGMVAENKQREIEGKSMAYTHADFAALIEEYGIYHNNFPFCGQ